MQSEHGKVKILGMDRVQRPSNDWSATVHLLLTHIRRQGFHKCPEPLILNDEFEILTLVPGDTCNYPLTGAVATVTALTSAARLLRELHDCSKDFLATHKTHRLRWMLPEQYPAEVICHGDFAPYNVTLSGDEVVGVFDFDAAHPGPVLWDIAYAVYCWAPFKTDPVDALGSLDQQIERAGLFCRTYGLSPLAYPQLVMTIIKRLEALVAFMVSQAEQGDPQFQDNLDCGHHLGYLNDIDYLRNHESQIVTMLMNMSAMSGA
ncbi:aminoglycoside phosphotransferase family protein [Gynuella sunshinyii]|uniref:Putative homoserine kinase type II (Protein kinase fold) n=1 Tax=Gynuella sunshinyii YC6258 TaxID=1445510 RepID=A0A0C5VFL4_9GAMM|nr:aminoglycoside phosphotransferase family protein [Gynuella sunshinyii]AJQ92976.1 putative homoserine kinase type II (protein kinase fold) [Gynuella sunshinyii YC6258]